MIRLGHIDYSNCVPVHARFLERVRPQGIELITGSPAELNELLAAGGIDVAPCSSIEFPRHAAEYLILPDLAIGSEGPVGSILLESEVPLEALAGEDVWVPTASATSAVLLRILLETRLGVSPRYAWYHQADGGDPIGIRAAAVLRIGDLALRRVAPPGRYVTDLGEAWTEWTGLPFVFALWQARAEVAPSLPWLHGLLLESRAYYEANAEALARRHASRYGLEPGPLHEYWRRLRFDLDDRMQEGLLRFYEHATKLGEAPAVAGLTWSAASTATAKPQPPPPPIG